MIRYFSKAERDSRQRKRRLREGEFANTFRPDSEEVFELLSPVMSALLNALFAHQITRREASNRLMLVEIQVNAQLWNLHVR